MAMNENCPDNQRGPDGKPSGTSPLLLSSPPQPFASDGGASRVKVAAVVGSGVLLLGILAVVIVLPLLSSEPAEEDKGPVQPAQLDPVPSPDVEASVRPQSPPDAREDSLAGEVQKVLQDALKLRARLENQGVEIWGAELLVTSYGQTLDSLAVADAHLDAKRFEPALEAYRAALARLEQLRDSKPERMRRAMEAGREAFLQLDGELSARHYQIALAVESTNAEAQIGLERASTLPQVLEYLSRGQAHAGNQELDLAKEVYEKAVALDDQYQPSHDGLEAVERLILERGFRRAMSDLLSALEQENVDQAKDSLAVVKRLRPEMADDIADLELQLTNIERRLALSLLSKQGLQHEQAEEWESALEVYSRALAVDAKTGFALVGTMRAEKAQELYGQVREYLSDPAQLSERQHLRHAQDIQERAIAKSEGAPKLRALADQLGRLIERYSTPISVKFESDGLTELRIFGVGRLGKYHSRGLSMCPGTYKIQGVRSGYRDVQLTFEVRCVGLETETVTLSCKDKL